MVLRSEKQEKVGMFGMANFDFVGRDWHSPLPNNQSQVAAVLSLKEHTFCLILLIINDLFAPSLEICTHYVMIKIKLKWCHAIITVSRFSLDTKINAFLFFIRINIFQSSLKLILNLSRFQPRNILRWFLKVEMTKDLLSPKIQVWEKIPMGTSLKV